MWTQLQTTLTQYLKQKKSNLMPTIKKTDHLKIFSFIAFKIK